MKDGILVLNKPPEWTSHDCVAVCRRVMRLKGVKKIGHGGTLDPMAEGVLPIFVGQATRIMEYLELDEKEYCCSARLGITTDTQDIWGDVLETKDFSHVREEDIIRCLESFSGETEQMPPMYSAVRINGKHLYEYAREGKKLDRKISPRRVFIHDMQLLDLDTQKGTLSFRVICSKGTYIRTICDDLGKMLGCGCAMTALTRSAVGNITLKGAVSPEEVKTSDPDALEEKLLAPDHPLRHFGALTLNADRADYYRKGGIVRLKQVKITERPSVMPDPLTGKIPVNARGRRYDRIYRVYQEDDGAFLGTGYTDTDNGLLRADKVFTALNGPVKIKE